MENFGSYHPSWFEGGKAPTWGVFEKQILHKASSRHSIKHAANSMINIARTASKRCIIKQNSENYHIVKKHAKT